MAKRFDCFYGPSGEGKSTGAKAIIKRVFEESGRKLKGRVYIGDGSAETYAGLVEAGMCELFDFTARDWPMTVCDNIAQGYWPNEKGILVPSTPEKLMSIGVTVFEGASVMSNYIMGDAKGGLAYRSGKGEKIGQDSPIQIKDDNGITVGGNPPSHYNVAQRRMVTYLEKSKALPGEWVIWTAHERSAEDQQTGEKIIGPEIAGKALTANISRMFNNTLHFTTVAKKVKVKDPLTEKMIDRVVTEYRVYTRDHYDPDGISFVKYKAVSRVAIPSMMPEFLAGEKPGENIVKFYELLYEAKQAELADLGIPA